MIDWKPLGDSGFLARFATAEAARDWARAVTAIGPEGVVDVVPAFNAVAILFDPDRTDPDALEAVLRGPLPRVDGVDEPESFVIPVLYDGDDLVSVATARGLDAAGVVAAHSGREYTVLAIGFQPGFPYAGPLPPELTGLSRRAEPRPRVPTGSVAIVGEQTAIYPSPSPGGWHLLGRTPLTIADPEAGFLPLRVGDRLRFAPIGPEEFAALDGRRLDAPPSRGLSAAGPV